MALTHEETVFLQVLSDGKRKTYVHIINGLGKPVSRMAPTIANRIAKPLLKQGLIKTAGIMRGAFVITDKGRSALADHSSQI